MAFQVQVKTSGNVWVQAGPASIATREDAEIELTLQIAEGADVDGCSFDGLPLHNGARIVEV